MVAIDEDLKQALAKFGTMLTAAVMTKVDRAVAGYRGREFAAEYRQNRRSLAYGGMAASEYVASRFADEGLTVDGSVQEYLTDLDRELPVPAHPLVPLDFDNDPLFV